MHILGTKSVTKYISKTCFRHSDLLCFLLENQILLLFSKYYSSGKFAKIHLILFKIQRNFNFTTVNLMIYINLKRAKVFINLMDYKHNESVWQNSYWAFRDVLMNCVTIDSPIEYLKGPMYAQVKKGKMQSLYNLRLRFLL